MFPSLSCRAEGRRPEVETSRQCGTFTIAIRTGSRPSDRRDSSTAPAATLGMTGICRLERSDSGVERSRVRRTFAAAIRKGSCHFTVETPRFRSASLGVTAFAVMLSGGAASPEVETSRPIGAFTLTTHPRSAQPAKDKRLSAVLRPAWLRTAGAKRLTDRLKPSENPE